MPRFSFALSTALLIFSTAFLPAHAALPLGTNSEGLPSLAPVIKQVNPAVVNIATRGHVEAQQNPLFNDPFFRRFFNVPQQQQEREVQSLGSGVIVDADKGLILTNNHVIENADEITVTLMDGREIDAKVIGADEKTDIAVVQIEADNLSAIELGDSDNLQVGDFVIAIGNPFGFSHTVTSGIVSALGRSGLNRENYENFIQTDASINPGNSGGALVNLRGELVGINTAIISRSGGNIGIGFAIPISMAQKVMSQIIEYGEVQRGVLGVYIREVTPDMATAMGIDIDVGALIVRVTQGSAAEKAGVKVGDVVIALNGEAIKSGADLRNRIGLLRVGEEIKLTLLRDGDKMTVDATIGTPEELEASTDGMHPKLAGATITELTEAAPQFGKLKGVLVANVTPRSPAARAGLQPGDIITSVNKQPIESVDEFRDAVKDKKTLLLNIQRDNGTWLIVIR